MNNRHSMSPRTGLRSTIHMLRTDPQFMNVGRRGSLKLFVGVFAILDRGCCMLCSKDLKIERAWHVVKGMVISGAARDRYAYMRTGRTSQIQAPVQNPPTPM